MRTGEKKTTILLEQGIFDQTLRKMFDAADRRYIFEMHSAAMLELILSDKGTPRSPPMPAALLKRENIRKPSAIPMKKKTVGEKLSLSTPSSAKRKMALD